MTKYNGYRVESNRMYGYDYSQNGYYFVTICTKNRVHLFGTIKNGKMVLNDIGTIVHHEWQQTALIRNNVAIDAFIVMPDHFHGIVIIRNDNMGRSNNQKSQRNRRDVLQYVSAYDALPHVHSHDVSSYDTLPNVDLHNVPPHVPQHNTFRSPSKSLGAIVSGFKSASTKQINAFRNTPYMPVWQSNYHDNIIRSEREYHATKQYIIDNPKRNNVRF